MANLGICLKCQSCMKVTPARVYDGQRLSMAHAWCMISGLGIIGWDMEVPDDCPYRPEHLLTRESLDDLAEEAREFGGQGDEE
jgi:hypothetical protein